MGRGTAKDFAGVDQDVTAFEKFITRYITVNQRWNSPKYPVRRELRHAALGGAGGALNNDGIEFKGVTLLPLHPELLCRVRRASTSTR